VIKRRDSCDAISLLAVTNMYTQHYVYAVSLWTNKELALYVRFINFSPKGFAIKLHSKCTFELLLATSRRQIHLCHKSAANAPLSCYLPHVAGKCTFGRRQMHLCHKSPQQMHLWSLANAPLP
jgi:hypothetical protein